MIMRSFDFEAVVYSEDDGVHYQILCVECLPEGIDIEAPGVSPIFVDQEWSYYPVCEKCGYVHDYVQLLDETVEMERYLGQYEEEDWLDMMEM